MHTLLVAQSTSDLALSGGPERANCREQVVFW